MRYAGGLTRGRHVASSRKLSAARPVGGRRRGAWTRFTAMASLGLLALSLGCTGSNPKYQGHAQPEPDAAGIAEAAQPPDRDAGTPEADAVPDAAADVEPGNPADLGDPEDALLRDAAVEDTGGVTDA